jgi:hypothetical protein
MGTSNTLQTFSWKIPASRCGTLETMHAILECTVRLGTLRPHCQLNLDFKWGEGAERHHSSFQRYGTLKNGPLLFSLCHLGQASPLHTNHVYIIVLCDLVTRKNKNHGLQAFSWKPFIEVSYHERGCLDFKENEIGFWFLKRATFESWPHIWQTYAYP